MNRILEESKVHIRTIVVPVDLSAVSEKTASYAVGLARNFGASIRFLHVFPPEAITEFTTGEVYEIYEREPSPVKERLAIFANYIRQTYPRCQTEIRVGDAAEQTKLAALELDADLIITASYHPGFLDRLFGLEQAPRSVNCPCCPVMVYYDSDKCENMYVPPKAR
jgi:nucleotide-binding universal stress UspA family protein